jgi:nitroreductase
MEFLDLVKKRHSTRVYQEKAISEPDLKYCLEASQFAPSAFNSQGFRFIVTTNIGKIKEIAKATKMVFIEKAAAVVVAIGTDLENKYNQTDVAIALDHFQLAAAEKNIGSCWVGTLGHLKVDEVFQIPKTEKVYAAMPLGYDAGKILEKKRKSFEELFKLES